METGIVDNGFAGQVVAKEIEFLMDSKFMPPLRLFFPPLIKGDNIERAFFEYVKKNNPPLKRQYINVNWANLYYNHQFKGYPFNEKELQDHLDKLPQNKKYFSILQYSSKLRHKLPPDTMTFGNSMGSLPMPLLYENDEVFGNVPYRSWSDKKTFCGFVGQHTHPIRKIIKEYVDRFDDYFYFEHPSGFPKFNTKIFLDSTQDTKFVLAPRGFGRSSYRFFEIVRLGSVPIYIWDDKIWLPFQNKIDYFKLAIVIHITELSKLDNILRAITEEEYEEMREYAKSIMYLFTFEGACKEFVKAVNKTLTISCHAGLGDQLIGYACSEVLAHELGAEVVLDMPIFSSESCPVSVTEVYKKKKKVKYDMEIIVDCQAGRDKMGRDFMTRSFWEKIHESDDIYIDNHTYILDTLINNDTGSVRFNNKTEIVQAMHRSLKRLFTRYCTVDYKRLMGYNLLKGENVVSLHIRTGDDIFMLQDSRVDKWPVATKEKLTRIFSSIGQHLRTHPPYNKYRLVLFSDLRPDDIHEFAAPFMPTGQAFFRYSTVKSIHSTRQKPSRAEWNKILDDFLVLAYSRRCYATPNSNFSRAALLLGNNSLTSSFFVESSGKISLVGNNVTSKPQNYL